jgi:hypothetical protein
MMKNATTVRFTKIRRSSTGDLNLLDKGIRPAVIVSIVSIKLTMRASHPMI